MTDKEKISKIINKYQSYGVLEQDKFINEDGEIYNGSERFTNNQEIADALIEAGIGNVKRLERRVKIVERALRLSAISRKTMLLEQQCHTCSVEKAINGFIEEAEREIAEETKKYK